MTELADTMDQAARPVEYTPAGDSTGVKAMADLSADAVQSGREGKYLTFSMADEEYGIGILKIKEIIGMMAITSVPQTPEFVKGVINLRGKVIPVVEMDKVIQQNAANAEENASASEEMNAQAEQMNSFVRELMVLVGGSASKEDGDRASTGTQPKTIIHKTITAPAKRAAPVEKAPEIHPDHVIPLDDGDFKEF